MMVQEDPGLPWPRVSVVVPVLNEARNLPRVFAKMPSDVYEVILVDGDSVDGTVTVARQLRPDVRIVMQTGKGKENALACGFAVATGDILVMFDGDGSADPGEIPRFVKALIDGADFARGTRFADGGGSNEITRLRRLGSHVLSGLVGVLCGAPTSATATTLSGGGISRFSAWMPCPRRLLTAAGCRGRTVLRSRRLFTCAWPKPS
jgi:glycosyltransferase involved in cell wall biosynthesis